MVPTLSDARRAIEAQRKELVPACCPPPEERGPGRPATIPDAMLWAAVLLCTLDKRFAQRDIWRLLTMHGVWDWTRRQVTDHAIYQRLTRQGPAAMAQLFDAVTVAIRDPPVDQRLAPRFRRVFALDETTLDQTRRQGRRKHLANGDDGRIPGKVTTVYDLRRQLFRRVRLHPRYRENEKVAAWRMVRTLPKGSLLVMDLGYFSFRWFDQLTKRRMFWVTRLREQTSYTVAHQFWAQDGRGEWLIWLGKHRADRAGGLVRLVDVRASATETRRYLTNVLTPSAFPATEVVQLYAARWNVERASNTIKTQLGLATPWAATWAVIQTQVWAVLTVAQIVGHLRLRVAEAAGVPVRDVSLDLLLQEVPRFIARGEDPVAAIGEVARIGPVGGIVRKHYDKPLTVPVPETIALPERGFARWRVPRYGGRRCGPNHTDRRPT